MLEFHQERVRKLLIAHGLPTFYGDTMCQDMQWSGLLSADMNKHEGTKNSKRGLHIFPDRTEENAE